jgi:hypothetical protein
MEEQEVEKGEHQLARRSVREALMTVRWRVDDAMRRMSVVQCSAL